MSRVSDSERAEIVVLLGEHNGNQNKVARLCGRSQPTVRRIAKAEGIESINTAPKKALEVKAAVEEINRLDGITTVLRVGVSLIEQLEGRQPTPEVMRAYKDGATGYAIGIDKHRLEMGEATERSERHSHDHTKSLEKYFADLDAFAAEHGEADSGEPLDTPRANGSSA